MVDLAIVPIDIERHKSTCSIIIAHQMALTVRYLNALGPSRDDTGLATEDIVLEWPAHSLEFHCSLFLLFD